MLLGAPDWSEPAATNKEIIMLKTLRPALVLFAILSPSPAWPTRC
jgi:hypothetical protein